MGDGAGVPGDAAQQAVAVLEVEQLGDGVAFLGDEPVDAAAHRQVQGVPGVEQAQRGGANGGAHGVGDPGPADAAQDGEVAQAAGGLLEVALEQEGQFAVGGPARLGDLAELGHEPHGGAPPLVGGGGDQLAGQGLVAGDVPGVEQAECDLDVVVGDGERLGQGAHRVVESEAGVPDRVPDGRGDPVDAGHPVVQQHQVEVAVRGTVAASEAADRDEADAGQLGRQEGGQPRVEGRRALCARGDADVVPHGVR